MRISDWSSDVCSSDLVEEELSIQDDVVAGQESLDPCVDGDAWFLPEQVGHGVVLLPESCGRGFSRELLMLPLPLRRQGEAGRGCPRFAPILTTPFPHPSGHRASHECGRQAAHKWLANGLPHPLPSPGRKQANHKGT